MTQERRTKKDRRRILFFRTRASDGPSKLLLLLTLASALVYFYCMAFVFRRGNFVLFIILMVGEVFHVWLAATYIHTIWRTESSNEFDPKFRPEVDVFITVAGEPVEIVEETAQAAIAMRYPRFSVHILNDGYVAQKSNWREIELMAERLGIDCITRTKPGGAKAGNINHALGETGAPFVAVFDADHVPDPKFLERTMGYFTDQKVAIVQTPQYYKNRDLNYVTAGAWEQQELFFGPICKGKNRTNSVFMCGTNMIVKRDALLKVGGMNESITEDFVTSIFIHQRGWKSVYVPQVLAEGLAPEDFLSYSKQQFRWARGSLEIIFKYNPLFMRGLTFSQRIEYLSSASYYFSGSIVLLDAMFPLIFFFTGLTAFNISTMALAAVFLPYMFLMTYTLQRSSNFAYTYRALSFSMASFPIHLKALWGVLTNTKSAFVVTSKTKISGNFLGLVTPQIIYILATVAGIWVAFLREGWSASLINNCAWAFFNIGVFVPFIIGAMPSRARADTSSGETEPSDIAVPSYKTYPVGRPIESKINYFTPHEHEDNL